MSTNRTGGFTLIELMITVVIVGLLAAIALPSYREQVRRSHRAEAKSILMENAQWMERNFTSNNCYHRDDGDCANTVANIDSADLPRRQAPESGAARYAMVFAASSPTANTYMLMARPTGGMSNDDCGTFTLNQLGQQGLTNLPAGSAKTPAECWSK